MLLILMTQLIDISFMQMKFQIFKITFAVVCIIIRQLNTLFENLPYYTLPNLRRSNFFCYFSLEALNL